MKRFAGELKVDWNGVKTILNGEQINVLEIQTALVKTNELTLYLFNNKKPLKGDTIMASLGIHISHLELEDGYQVVR